MVERKSLSDFYNSVNNGRLGTELSKCMDEGQLVRLLLEWDEHVPNLLSVPRYTSYLASIQLQGVQLLISPARSETGVILKYAYYNDQKPTHTSIRVAKTPTVRKGRKGRNRLVEEFQYVLDRIGEERSKVLVQKFPSWDALLKANVSALQVGTITPQIAESIWQYLHKGAV